MENCTFVRALPACDTDLTKSSICKNSLVSFPSKSDLEMSTATRTGETVSTQKQGHHNLLKSHNGERKNQRVPSLSLLRQAGKKRTILGILQNDKPKSFTTRLPIRSTTRARLPREVEAMPLSFSRTPISLMNFSSKASDPLAAPKDTFQLSARRLDSVIKECSSIEKNASRMHGRLAKLQTVMKQRFEDAKKTDGTPPPRFRRVYISNSVNTFRREKKAFIYGPEFRGKYIL